MRRFLTRQAVQYVARLAYQLVHSVVGKLPTASNLLRNKALMDQTKQLAMARLETFQPLAIGFDVRRLCICVRDGEGLLLLETGHFSIILSYTGTFRKFSRESKPLLHPQPFSRLEFLLDCHRLGENGRRRSVPGAIWPPRLTWQTEARGEGESGCLHPFP
jgi:hypothetical protein